MGSTQSTWDSLGSQRADRMRILLLLPLFVSQASAWCIPQFHHEEWYRPQLRQGSAGTTTANAGTTALSGSATTTAATTTAATTTAATTTAATTTAATTTAATT